MVEKVWGKISEIVCRKSSEKNSERNAWKTYRKISKKFIEKTVQPVTRGRFKMSLG